MAIKKSLLGVLLSITSHQALAQTEQFVLEDSVVSASGFEQDIKEAPASISVIKNEDLQTKAYRDVAEAIADIPGVDLFASKGKTGTYNITMRGITGYTLILVDGRRQSVGGDIGPNGFNEVATAFLPPISAIERIEVIKGPISHPLWFRSTWGSSKYYHKENASKMGCKRANRSNFQSRFSMGKSLWCKPLYKRTLSAG